MIKTLRIRDEKTNEFINKEMRFDDVVKMLDRIMIKKSNELYNKLSGVQQNILEKEDIISIYMTDIYNVFEVYDINKGAFTTVAFKSIDNCSKRILRDLFAQKRTNESWVLSLEGTKDDLDAIEKLNGEYDDTFSNIELAYDLKRTVSNFTYEEKQILKFIIGRGLSKKDLAIHLGVSRPTLDTRIKKLKDRLSNSLKEYIA